MTLEQQDDMASLQKEMVKVAALEAPGTILLGLALFAKFDANAGALHPMLGDTTVITCMFVAGGVIMAWGATKAFSIAKRMQQLKNR